MSVKIVAKGLDELQQYFERAPEIADQAMSMAINDVAGGTGLTMLRKAVYDDINFPNGYVNKDRLGLKQRATPTKLQAKVQGRDRPTSLARFAVRGQTAKNTRGRGGVRVTVKRGGGTKVIGKSWLVNLRNGNTGLAIRLKPGERISAKTADDYVQLAPNVYLLYGPSVDQVFAGVAFDKRDDIERMVADEFYRQFRRLSSG